RISELICCSESPVICFAHLVNPGQCPGRLRFSGKVLLASFNSAPSASVLAVQLCINCLMRLAAASRYVSILVSSTIWWRLICLPFPIERESFIHSLLVVLTHLDILRILTITTRAGPALGLPALHEFSERNLACLNATLDFVLFERDDFDTMRFAIFGK